jgi:hypothetical protein
MTLTITVRSPKVSDQQLTPEVRAKQTHSKALPINTISLEVPGRLRAGHLMTFFSISHSTLHNRVKTGRIPKPDGTDGPGEQGRPYWNTSTVKAALGC